MAPAARSKDSFERWRAWRVSTKLSWEHARPRASLCGMKIGDQIVVDDRVFLLRGVDPMSVAARRVYLEDAETGELVTELLARARTLVGLAGTVTTVAAMALELPTYQPERIHHAHVHADDVRRVADRLLHMTHGERAALPFMHPGRVDVIGAGALLLSTVLDHVPVDEIVVSEHDILDGIAWSMVAS